MNDAEANEQFFNSFVQEAKGFVGGIFSAFKDIPGTLRAFDNTMTAFEQNPFGFAGAALRSSAESTFEAFVTGDTGKIVFDVLAGATIAEGANFLEDVSIGNGLKYSANFAQRNFRESFSEGGVTEFKKITGQTFNTINELSDALRSGTVQASRIPVNIIVRNENTLILNTRTVQALERGGIPRSLFNVIDRTGDEFFEKALDVQLKRSNLTSEGFSRPISRGN